MIIGSKNLISLEDFLALPDARLLSLLVCFRLETSELISRLLQLLRCCLLLPLDDGRLLNNVQLSERNKLVFSTGRVGGVSDLLAEE